MQRDGNPGCGFASWIDPEMYERSKRIIHSLLRKINAYEEEIEKLKNKCAGLENELEALRKKCYR